MALDGLRSEQGRPRRLILGDLSCGSVALAVREHRGPGLGAPLVDELGPGFLPAIRAGHAPQGQEGVDVHQRPVHPGALQPCFHHQLVAAFHDATADRPAIRLKAWVLDLLLFAFLEIGQIGGYFRGFRMSGLQSPQFNEQPPGPIMLEPAEPFLEPLLSPGGTFSIQ